jgi:mono/diheme cytochrome c family protein
MPCLQPPFTPPLPAAAVLVAAVLALVAPAAARQNPPAPPAGQAAPQTPALRPGIVPRPVLDKAAIDRGAGTYRAACAFCHGIDARGAQGPDLARSLYVLNDDRGRDLGAFLRVGRPANGMPAFPALTDGESADLSAFLNDRIAASRTRPPMDPAGIVVGNAAAGEAYFNGAGGCSACHSPAGDLKGVGGRYNPMVLQGRMLNPRVVAPGRGQPVPNRTRPTVKVTTGGQVLSGTLESISDFHVTFVDATGVRRTVPRDNEVPRVEVTDPAAAHLELLGKYTDQDMWNLTAYLVTLK